jgi:hypothetical protein
MQPRRERVTFENWAERGCHIFIEHKCVLTLNTPESSALGDPYNTLLEDWISPDEYCATLMTVLQALGASPAILEEASYERQNYERFPVTPPQRTKADLMRERGIELG